MMGTCSLRAISALLPLMAVTTMTITAATACTARGEASPPNPSAKMDSARPKL